ncbi:MAG: hypothetical protein KA035_04245 [Candidatus Levybacteria bacterium]|nr:hypothetical protein [Candidatus Levybacteria bacterium]
MNKKIILLGIIIFVLIGSIGVTLYLTQSSQDNRSGAQQVADEEVCPDPSPPSDVLVDYPNCEGTQCDFNKANCSWGDSLDATTYNVTVVQVESNQEVVSETVPSSTTKVVFDVVQKTTYRCTVTAVNTCGSTSVGVSAEQYCENDALVEATPVPTTPVNTPIPTASLAPTVFVAPTAVIVNETLPPTGGVLETAGIVVGVVAALAVGAFFFMF